MSTDRAQIIAEALDQFSAGLSVLDQDLRVVYTNAVARKVLELPDELFAAGPPNLADIIRFNSRRGEYGPGDVEAQVEARIALARQRVPHNFHRTRPDGTILEIRGMPTRDGGFITTYTDVTDRARAEALIRGQAKILAMIAMGAPLQSVLSDLLSLVDAQLQGIKSSILLLDGQRLRHGAAPSLPEAYCKLVDGIEIGPDVGSCGSAAYRKAPVFVMDIESDPLWSQFVELARPYGFRSCWSTQIVSVSGEVLGTFAMYSGTVRAPTQREFDLIEVATRIAGIAIDRQRAEDRIKYMATHDALTGVLSRSALAPRLDAALAAAEKNGRRISLVFVDLDNFKLVNDSLGHKAGDDLLRIIGARMRAAVTADEAIVRLGGDEFVLILDDSDDADRPTPQRVEALRLSIAQPVLLGGREFSATCSMGIASYPEDGRDAAALLANADAAMYRAKSTGRNSVRAYANGEEAESALVLKDDLGQALRRGQLGLVYQPLVEIGTGLVVGMEALLRWHHPQRGVIPPAEFIRLAEETGAIVEIGRWVLQESCRQAMQWQSHSAEPVRICVNVSPRQFKNPDLVDDVAQALMESGLPAGCLELELTENMLMHDVDDAIVLMEQLRDIGVNLSIDDFGTGYSNLSALRNFPVTRLKIDKSLLADLDSSGRATMRAVVALGHALRMSVVAEGVESADQLTFLQSIACDEGQGFHIARPVVAGEVAGLIGRNHARFTHRPDDALAS